MVGDSDVDIATAHNAGMIHVGVSWGYRSEKILREKGAKYVAHDMNALYALIKEIQISHQN